MLFDLLRLASIGQNMELLSRLHQQVPNQQVEQQRSRPRRLNHQQDFIKQRPDEQQQPIQTTTQCKPLDLSTKTQPSKQARPRHLDPQKASEIHPSKGAARGRAKTKRAVGSPAKLLISSSTSPISSGSRSGSSVTSEESKSNEVIITSSNGHLSKRQKHKGLKCHLCIQCGRSFSRSDMLTRHSRLHSGLKPYQCSRCKQVFSRSDHLSTHERTHTGEKPYQCEYCAYSACRRDMITRHLRTHASKGRTKRLKSNRRQDSSAAISITATDDISSSLDD